MSTARPLFYPHEALQEAQRRAVCADDLRNRIPPACAVWTFEDVACALRLTPEEFEVARGRLQRDCGFPRHLPGLGRKWSRALVLQWIDHNGEQSSAAAEGGKVHDASPVATILRRYGGAQ